MASSGAPGGATRPRRLPLGPKGRRFSFERRLSHKLWMMGLPAAALVAILFHDSGVATVTASLLVLALAWAILVSVVMESVVRPLQTLGNVVAALREDDFSFRARGGRRDDALGDLAIEVNALAATLQGQRTGALEAVALADRMMSAMPTPVIAFDRSGRLQMLNSAAKRILGLRTGQTLARIGPSISLESLRSLAEGESIQLEGGRPGSRWVVRRTEFRMRGVPHTLAVLSEVSSALRGEERNAWRRLVRVMGHEINNSLTPIKSIAGSLGERLRSEPAATREIMDDLVRGLGVIENRAESLNRFLQAYRQLSGLPRPRIVPVLAAMLIQRVAHLVRGVDVEVVPGPEDLVLAVDEDQIQQALINLLKNAVEAALVTAESTPEVSTGWSIEGNEVSIWVLDNGLGISNPGNLFVPFYTTKPEGAGIGLALALQIAEGHEGTVRLVNRKGGSGCCAEIRLPLRSSVESAMATNG